MKMMNMRTKFAYTNRGESMHNPTLRVAEVLNFLSKSSSPMRLSDISRELNMPKSTLLPIWNGRAQTTLPTITTF